MYVKMYIYNHIYINIYYEWDTHEILINRQWKIMGHLYNGEYYCIALQSSNMASWETRAPNGGL